MDKQSNPITSGPLPTAPPSYEEAIAYPGRPPNVASPPYPVVDSAMPMPSSQSGAVSMPIPTQQNEIQQHYVTQDNFAQPRQEIRIVHQHVNVALGPNPEKMSCPSCHANIKTTTVADHQPTAHICCIILCIIGCCLCSCLPYCMSSFMSVHHFCPNCKAYIGTWKG